MAFDPDPTVTHTGPRRMILTLDKTSATGLPEASMRLEIGASDGGLWGGRPRFPSHDQIIAVLTPTQRQQVHAVLNALWAAAEAVWPTPPPPEPPPE